MESLLLFTDGSVNVQTKVGYGAYLFVSEKELSSENLKSNIKLVRFENTSSTRLELETLMWATKEIAPTIKDLIIYTDSQNIAGLPERYKRLEQNDYRSKKGLLLKNHELYKKFFKIFNSRNYRVIKIQGHRPIKQKNEIERIFTLVDRASRKALRGEI